MAVAALLAAALAGWASGTAPFSVLADVAVSVPSALLAALLVAQRVAPTRRLWRPRALPVEGARDRRTSAPWVALIVLVLAVELASYFHPGPRSLYPTLSSIADRALRCRPVKAAAFLGWLAGGWYLVRR